MANPLGIADEFIAQRPSGLREMLFGARLPHTKVTLRGGEWGQLDGVTIALRSLPAGAQAQALGVAIEWLTKTAKMSREDVYSESGEGTLDMLTRAAMLARALVDPTTLKPLCEGIADVIGTLDDSEDGDKFRPGFTSYQITWLFDEYDRFQQARSPFKAVSAKEIEEVADALGKGVIPATSLRSYARPTLVDIATALVSRLTKRTTPSSTDTSSPTSSGDASSEP